MKKTLLQRDTFFATIFVLLVTAMLEVIVVNIHVFDPFRKAFRDFEYTDIYYSRIRQQKNVDTGIVVVNIGKLERDSIALMLEKIIRSNPAVIGIDASFIGRKDFRGDSLLKNALNASQNIITTGELSIDSRNKEYIAGSDPWFGHLKTAYANLTGNKLNTSTIRMFKPFVKAGDSLLYSFAAAVVQQADSAAFTRLLKRNNTHELIRYNGGRSSFICLDFPAVFYPAAGLGIMNNRIVLMGYLGEKFGSIPDLEDLHFTPLNPTECGRSAPDMYGVLIHANIISMIIGGSFINAMSDTTAWILAFILCYFHMAFFIHFYLRRHKWFHFSGKMLQFFTTVVLVLSSYLTYHYLSYKAVILPSVVVILLSMDLLYFYEGLMLFLNRRFHVRSLFSESKEGHP